MADSDWGEVLSQVELKTRPHRPVGRAIIGEEHARHPAAVQLALDDEAGREIGLELGVEWISHGPQRCRRGTWASMVAASLGRRTWTCEGACLVPMAQNYSRPRPSLRFTVWRHGPPRKSVARRRDGEGDDD